MAQPAINTEEEIAEGKETGRLEAFSDGVFAVAITLLIFTLKTLQPDPQKTLLSQIGEQWPAYLAYVTSFLTVLIMWVNHHALFKLISRTDQYFLLINGLLLMAITFVTYPTSLLANFIGGSHNDEQTAAIIYSATGILIAILYNALWFYAARNNRLLSKKADPALVHSISHQYRFGPLFYLLALVVAFVSVVASVAINLALALFFAFTGTSHVIQVHDRLEARKAEKHKGASQ